MIYDIFCWMVAIIAILFLPPIIDDDEFNSYLERFLTWIKFLLFCALIVAASIIIAKSFTHVLTGDL